MTSCRTKRLPRRARRVTRASGRADKSRRPCRRSIVQPRSSRAEPVSANKEVLRWKDHRLVLENRDDALGLTKLEEMSAGGWRCHRAPRRKVIPSNYFAGKLERRHRVDEESH